MKKIGVGITCLVIVSSNLPCSMCNARRDNVKVVRKRSRTQQLRPPRSNQIQYHQHKEKKTRRILDSSNATNYEIPMMNLRLAHQQVDSIGKGKEGEEIMSSMITTEEGPIDYISTSFIRSSATISVPSFILEYRINAGANFGTNDFETIKNRTRIFIMTEAEKKFNQRGVEITEKSFGAVRNGIEPLFDIFEIIYVPLFLFDSKWKNVPSEIDMEKFLEQLFSGLSLEEYESILSMLGIEVTSVVFKWPQQSRLDPQQQESRTAPYLTGACAGIITILILFVWKQSMRIRALLKRTVKGFETETMLWDQRRQTEGTEEKTGYSNPRESLNKCYRHQDASNFNEVPSRTEVTSVGAFPTTVFPDLTDLEANLEPSQYTNESLETNDVEIMRKQKRSRRSDLSLRSTGSDHYKQLSTGHNFWNCIGSVCNYSSEAENSSQKVLEPGFQKVHSTLDAIFGTIPSQTPGFSKLPDKALTIMRKNDATADDCGFRISDQSHKVTSSCEVEEIFQSESEDSSFDSSLYSSGQDSATERSHIDSISRCYQASRADSTDGASYSASEPKCDTRQDELNSSSDYSHQAKTILSSENCIQRDEALLGNSTNTECLPWRCIEDISVDGKESSKTPKTRLHTWLMNQTKHQNIRSSKVDTFPTDSGPQLQGDSEHLTNQKREDQLLSRTILQGRNLAGSRAKKSSLSASKLRVMSKGRTSTSDDRFNVCVEKETGMDRALDRSNSGMLFSQPFQETKMNPGCLFQELREHFMIQETEHAEIDVEPRHQLNATVGLLSDQNLVTQKQVSPQNNFICELKERLASRARQQRHEKLKPVDGTKMLERGSSDLIRELKLTLASREKRIQHVDFTAVESKNNSRVFPDCELILELKQKIAKRHLDKQARSTNDEDESQYKTVDNGAALSNAVRDHQNSTAETVQEPKALCPDSKLIETTKTIENIDSGENVFELGDHFATRENEQQVRDCETAMISMPVVIRARASGEEGRNTPGCKICKNEDLCSELRHLNQILESESDSESTNTLSRVDEVADLILGSDNGSVTQSKYPWKRLRNNAQEQHTRQHRLLVFDFVTPGKTRTHEGSTDTELLSRYKDDILKERRESDIDRSLHGDLSMSSMPSYNARLFARRREKAENVPWWLPDESDSSTSRLDRKSNDGVTGSSTEEDSISTGSSSYDATNSTRSSFALDMLKQR